MKKTPCLFLTLLFPCFLFAQTNIWSDSAKKKVLEDDCHGMIFTKVEEVPSLKISTESYADSLLSYLKTRSVRLKNRTIIFSFIVTSKSDIVDLEKLAGDVPDEKVYEEAILNFSDLWIPARQNSRIVCAYLKLQLDLNKDKVSIKIM